MKEFLDNARKIINFRKFCCCFLSRERERDRRRSRERSPQRKRSRERSPRRERERSPRRVRRVVPRYTVQFSKFSLDW